MAVKLTPNAQRYNDAFKKPMGGPDGKANFDNLTKLSKSLGPEDRASLQKLGFERMGAGVAARGAQHPDKAPQLQALGDKIAALPADGKSSGLGGMGGALGMFSQLTAGERKLLHDTARTMGMLGGGGGGMFGGMHDKAMDTIRSIR